MRDSGVALVGRRLLSNENLGLGYLRAALDRAGVQSETHYLNDGEDLWRIARALIEHPPAVVGLSLADSGSAILPLALGDLLRGRGFTGHITCGGQFATLARGFLLGSYPWLDSVVRFAGEIPIVELSRRVANGESVHGLGGVTTRAGDGPPAPVLDDAPMRLWPRHDELPEILGWPAAHIAATRGCKGRCHYCSPAALQTLEREEGRAAGATLSQLGARGIGGVRRRDIDDVCDEMACLVHERGVRYFYFVDEHLLPYRERDALDFLAAWGDGLAKRKLGTFGIGAMLRADRITPKIVEAFAEVGLVRCFVGLELASAEEGRLFGRPAPGARELELLADFARHGVATVSNLMLVNPASTLSTIANGIELLERVPGGVFEATRMMVYHGTRLYERLLQQGRVLGNPFRYGYSFDDPRVEGFAEIFSRLRAEAFWDYSIAYRTHDTHLGVALARRVAPGGVRPALDERLERTRRGVNRLYVSAYRRALALAIDGGRYGEAAPLVDEVRARAQDLERELDRIEREVIENPRSRVRVFAPTRAAAASVISFALLGAPSTSGCYLSHGRDGESHPDAGPPPRRDSGPHVCTDADRVSAIPEVQRVAAEADRCFNGWVGYESGSPDARFYVNAYGMSGLGFGVCYPTTSPAAIEARVESALRVRGPECATGTNVAGGAQTDLDRLAGAVDASCSGLLFSGASLQIVLDATGAVADVVTASPELSACVRRVLAGLVFPCLASFEVCPEFVIAE